MRKTKTGAASESGTARAATPGRAAEGGRRRSDTRRRTLDAARDLFNARGVDRVTTRLIADTVGINEGNLYYHFRTKESLYVTLFGQFEEQASALTAPVGESRHDLARHIEGLRRWFLLTWTYRFLFQDMVALQSAAPTLRPRLKRLSVRLQAETRRSLADLDEAGLVRIPPGSDELLLANVWIVSSYWISYLALQIAPKRVGAEHLRWGYGQVLGLYLPYLTERAMAELLALPDVGFE